MSEVVESRWVSCGYSANWQPDPSYQDAVSEAVLERLYRSGVLGRAMREYHPGAMH
jgi:hypothetical protein